MIDTAFKSERLWSLDKLVEVLAVKKSWVYDQTSRKKIPHVKVAGKLMFDPVEIDLWLNSQPGCSLKISGNLAGRRKD
jgi:predicted DNA-binding transcriptional regulator AlpA